MQSNTDEHNSETNHDSKTATPPVSQNGGNRHSANRTGRHNGVKKTEFGSGGLEVCQFVSKMVEQGKILENIQFSQFLTAWRPFIIEPSKPLVAETKMTVPSKK